MNTYQLDSLITLTNTFTLADGVTPVDPSTVNLYVRDPLGTVTEYTGGDITRVSEGVYAYNLLVGQSGPWIYKWQGTGTVEITSDDVYFTVAQSAAVAG